MNIQGSAVVGTGFIGPVHIEALRRLGVPIQGILGSSPEKSKKAAEDLGLPRGYQTFSEMLADPKVTVIHLASPNVLHFEQCKAVLQAGKHVICEKPLAMNSQQSAELVSLANNHPVVTAVCYNVRFYPLCLQARHLIQAGQLGEIYHVMGGYVQDWLLYETDFNWRVLAEDGGQLRAVADIGTHWLDLVQSITGMEVVKVCADLKTCLPTRQRPKGSVETFQSKMATPVATEPVQITTEDYGAILLRFRGGPRGTLVVSQVSAGRKNCIRIEIAGSKGSLAWNSETPNELWLGRRDQANAVLLRDPALMASEVRPFANYPGGHNEGFPDTFKQLFRSIYSYIAAGNFQAPRNFPTFTSGHQEVLLCEAILKSHREERWVTLGK